MQQPPERVRQLVSQIASGQLDAETAAREILGIPSPANPLATLDPADGEGLPTIGSLIRVHGPPPAEIERDWRRQVENLERQWERTHGSPLPPTQWEAWLVDEHNRLLPRRLTDPTRLHGWPTALHPDDQTPHGPAPRPRNSRSWRFVAVGLLTVVGLGVFWASNRRSASSPDQVSGSHRPPSPRTPTDSPAITPARPPSRLTSEERGGNRAVPEGDNDRLQWMSDPRMPGSDWTEIPPIELESLALSDPVAVTPHEIGADLLVPTGVDPPGQELPAEGQDEQAEQDELVSPADEPVDQPLPARSASPEMALTLPAPPQQGRESESLPLTEHAVTKLEWDFPVASPIVLQPLAEGSWALVDQRDSVELAFLSSSDEGLRFAWSAIAAGNSLVSQIPAGRLRLSGPDDHASQRFLRPWLRSEPIRFDLTQPDSRVSWSLQGPPVFSEPLVAIEVESPPSVTIEWSQAPDPTQVRRGNSLIQWRLPDSDFPAIRCRLESRVNARWSLRFRYAVQLDETLPWQTFSARSLNASLDQLTFALNQALAEQSDITRRYSAATPAARRPLKPAKDGLDQRVQLLQQRMQLIRKLQTLAAGVAESRLKIGLSTAWTDRRQTLFELTDAP